MSNIANLVEKSHQRTFPLTMAKVDLKAHKQKTIDKWMNNQRMAEDIQNSTHQSMSQGYQLLNQLSPGRFQPVSPRHLATVWNDTTTVNIDQALMQARQQSLIHNQQDESSRVVTLGTQHQIDYSENTPIGSKGANQVSDIKIFVHKGESSHVTPGTGRSHSGLQQRIQSSNIGENQNDDKSLPNIVHQTIARRTIPPSRITDKSDTTHKTTDTLWDIGPADLQHFEKTYRVHVSKSTFKNNKRQPSTYEKREFQRKATEFQKHNRRIISFKNKEERKENLVERVNKLMNSPQGVAYQSISPGRNINQQMARTTFPQGNNNAWLSQQSPTQNDMNQSIYSNKIGSPQEKGNRFKTQSDIKQMNQWPQGSGNWQSQANEPEYQQQYHESSYEQGDPSQFMGAKIPDSADEIADFQAQVLPQMTEGEYKDQLSNVKAIHDLQQLIDEMQPRRQTINLKGTHFLKHKLHDVDPVHPSSYKVIMPNKKATKFSQFIQPTARQHQEPILRAKESGLSNYSQEKSPAKTVIIKYIKDVANQGSHQQGSGGPSKFIQNHREKLRETYWKAPYATMISPSNLSQKKASQSNFPGASNYASIIDSATTSNENILGITNSFDSFRGSDFDNNVQIPAEKLKTFKNSRPYQTITAGISPVKQASITQRNASNDLNTKGSINEFQTSQSTFQNSKPKFLQTRICLVQDQLDQFFHECDIKDANKEQALALENQKLHEAFQKDFSEKQERDQDARTNLPSRLKRISSSFYASKRKQEYQEEAAKLQQQNEEKKESKLAAAMKNKPSKALFKNDGKRMHRHLMNTKDRIGILENIDASCGIYSQWM